MPTSPPARMRFRPRQSQIGRPPPIPVPTVATRRRDRTRSGPHTKAVHSQVDVINIYPEGGATVGNDSVASSERRHGLALRNYTYYRPTILALLKERESHGYELASRITELGFDQRLASSIYKVLRDL